MLVLVFLFVFVASVFSSECDHRAARRKGAVVNVTPLNSCPPGFGFNNSNTKCTNITIVDCKDCSDRVAVYGVIEPCNAFKGTIEIIGGGGATAVFDMGYINNYTKRGFRVVLLVFYPPGWNPSNGPTRQNLKAAACLPSTAHEYLFNNVHFGDTSTPFCIHGHSGGAASIGYLMAWYEGDEFLDYGLMSAGPIFSSMLNGCRVPLSPPILVCPPNENYCGQQCESFLGDTSFANTFGSQCAVRGIALTGFPCACPNISSTPEMLEWWTETQILSPCADTFYTHTGLSSWVCRPPVTNVHAGMAEEYARSIFAVNGYNEYLISNCTGSEGIWGGVFAPTGQNGLLYSSNVMEQQCVPRHKYV